MENCQAENRENYNSSGLDINILDVLYEEILLTIEGKNQQEIRDKLFLLKRLRRG